MTWIKPSFLWMMERSAWATKAGQEYVLAVRITRAAWEAALAEAILTDPDSRVYSSQEAWRRALDDAPVRVQWDPERTLRGEKLDIRSIQVGLSRHVIEAYARHWVTSIEDLTPLVRKLRGLRQSRQWDQAARLLPPERPYPLAVDIQQRLGMV
jgi:hypothetical protein